MGPRQRRGRQGGGVEGREATGSGHTLLVRRDSHVTVGMSLHLPKMPLLMNRSAVLKSRKLQKSFLLQVCS